MRCARNAELTTSLATPCVPASASCRLPLAPAPWPALKHTALAGNARMLTVIILAVSTCASRCAVIAMWLQVRLVSKLPWLAEGSTVEHLQWTPSSAGLLALVSEVEASGAAAVFHRSCRIELLVLGDGASYDLTHADGRHTSSAALPGSNAAPRVQLSADAVKRYAAACPFVSRLPALPDLYSTIAEGAPSTGS